MMSQKSDSASNLPQRSAGKQVHLPTEASHSPHDSPISRAAFSSTSPLPPIGGDTVNDHDDRGKQHGDDTSSNGSDQFNNTDNGNIGDGGDYDHNSVDISYYQCICLENSENIKT